MRYPLAGTETTLNLAIEVIPLYNAEVDLVDYTSAKDSYTCDLLFCLSSTESALFTELIESTYRGVEVSLTTLLGGAYDGFHPFGPHVDLTGSDLVKIISYSDNGQKDPFGKFWTFSVTIVPVGELTYYTSTTTCAAGGFKFGGLSNFYLPEFSPNIEYKVGNSRYGRNTYLHHNAEAVQHKITTLEFSQMDTGGARNILIETTRNIRAMSFTMNGGSNRWPFSERDGQGDKTVKLAKTDISFSNVVADRWNAKIEVIKC